MFEQEPRTARQIDDLFAHVRQERDVYEQMYPFFKALFILKEEAMQACRPAPLSLETGTLRTKRAAGLPLIDRVSLPVDLANASKLITDIFSLTAKANPQLQQAANRFQNGLTSQSIDLNRCYRSLLAENSEVLQNQADVLGLSADQLLFFLYHSLWPSIAVQRNEGRHHLPGEHDWGQGYCPFCGGLPVLALLADNGQRRLVCSFCIHTWSSKRLFCPFCGNTHPDSLGYFFSEAEVEYRVQTCHKCRSYFKTVDLRLMTRPLYLPLEILITTHLDIQAREQGFENSTPPWFSL